MPRPLDILVVSHACLTSVNRAAYRLLQAQEWSVEIILPQTIPLPGGSKAADPAAEDDPPLHLLPLSSYRLRFAEYPGICDVLGSRKPRIVLLENDPASRMALTLGKWARKNDSRLVCLSCENLSPRLVPSFRRQGGRGAARSLLIQFLSRLARPRVDHVFVISNDGQRVFEDLGYIGRVTRIPLGFDPALFRPDADARARIRGKLGLQGVAVAYFGRMMPEKGVHLLVRALGRLKSLEWQFLLDEFNQYENPYQKELRALIDQEGIADRVVFFDATHSEMPAYMNAADIVVIPSISAPHWKEQYGRVLPEAMACGRAVIVSQSGTLPELAGGAARLVPEGDVDALAEAITELHACPAERQRLGDAAHARAQAHLTLQCQVDQMARIFNRLPTR